MGTPTTSKPALLRQLGVISATALVVSNMIGAMIFTTTGFLAGDLGSPKLVLWIWVVGAVCAILGAVCYSELGINLPSSGGEYVYLTRAFGPTWGFMAGWVSFFAGFSGPIAVSALAFADYLGHFCKACAQEQPHVLIGSGDLMLAFGKPQMFACGLVLLFTVLNVLGIQRSAKVQNVLTSAKIILLVTFVIGALAVGQGSWSHLSMPAVRTAHTSIPAQFAISLFWIYLAYSGWNAATYVAEELRQPGFTLPRALTIGTLLVAALYISLNFVFIYAAPLENMKGEMAVGALAAARLFGPGIANMFSALVALALMSAVNAMVTIGPRVYYAMAKNGAFISSAAWVHPKWHTPVMAIVAQAICTMLMTMTPFPQLVVYIGFLLNFFAVMSVASLMLFRRRPGWRKLKAVSFCYPLIPSLFILVGMWMTIYGIVLKPFVSMATLATVLAGAFVFHLRARSQQRVAAATPSVETY